MAQGTLSLTNNSADVTGQGTAFLTDIKEGDFLLASVAGLSYFLNVKTITSDTALTLTAPYIGETASSVGFDVIPKESLVNVPSGLIYESSRALRAQNLDKENWQKVFSVDDDITVTLIDGSQYTGISWLKASKGISSANVEAVTALAEQISQDASSADNSASQAAASSSAAQSAQSAAEAARDKAQTAQSAAEASETAADKSASAAATSETNAASANSSAQSAKDSATASASAASKSETNAASAASAAKQSETNAANSASSANTADTSAQAAQKAAETAQAAAESANSTAQTAMSSASDSATAAAASAKAAATSETNAAASSETAQAAQDGVAASAAAAAQSETNASNSEKAASASETAAANSAESASSASSAASAAQEAAETAQAAAESANATAQTAQTNASNSAAAAAASESAAGKSAEDAASSSETAQAAQSVVAASAEAAAQSESNAKSSESAAASSQAAAETAASQASTANTSALAAQSAAEAAQAAAESANDTAQTAQTNASSSAQSASDSADTATAQATEAGNQADLAKQYADSLNSDLLMAKANNLSDVADPATARENLNVDRLVQISASTNLNYPTQNAAFVLRDSDLVWGVYDNDSAQWKPLGTNQGGTGATTYDEARLNLGVDRFHEASNLTSINSPDNNSALIMYDGGTWGAANYSSGTFTGWQALAIAQGGTGANNYIDALKYLNAFPFQRTALGTVNLNTIDGASPGVYVQNSNANATITNNYPVSAAGALIVVQNAANGTVACTQIYYPYNNNVCYQRLNVYSASTGAVWTDWKQNASIGDYGLGALGTLTPSTQNNQFISDSDGNTAWAPLNGVGIQSSYASSRCGQFWMDTSGRMYSRFLVNSTNPQTPNTTVGWNTVVNANLANTFSGSNTFNGDTLFSGYITNSAANPVAIRSANPTLSFVETDSSPANSSYMFVADGGNFRLNRDNTGGVQIIGYTRSTNGLSFGVSAAGFAGTLQAASYSNTSDKRAKYNTVQVTDALSKIITLTGITFNMRTGVDTEITAAGVFAQDIEKILPEAIGQCVAYDKEGNEIPDALSVDYSALSALYVEAFKEVKSIITDQQSQIDELKAIVAQLLGSSSDQVAGS